MRKDVVGDDSSIHPCVSKRVPGMVRNRLAVVCSLHRDIRSIDLPVSYK